MIIAERLKAARKECKLTQQQVADILGIDRSTYSYYELGMFNPSIENLISLSAIFKTDLGWLIGTDREGSGWNSPESELKLIKSVKEKHMSELSKEERQVIALLRAAKANETDKDIIRILMNAAGKNKND